MKDIWDRVEAKEKWTSGLDWNDGSGDSRMMYKWKPFKHNVFGSRLGMHRALLGLSLDRASLSYPWMQEPPTQCWDDSYATPCPAKAFILFYLICPHSLVNSWLSSYPSAGYAIVDSSLPSNHFLSLLWGAPATFWFFFSLPGLLVSAGCYVPLLVGVEHPSVLPFALLLTYTHSLG